MHRARWIAGVIALAALGLTLWSSRATLRSVGPERGNEAPEPFGSVADPMSESAPLVVSEPAPSERQSIEGEVRTLRGRVLGQAGEALEGATVTWTALSQLHFGATYVWDVLELLPGEVTLETTSLSDGSFQFSSLPSGFMQGQSVIWVTAPGFMAGAELVDLERVVSQPPLEIRLALGREIAVRVVDGADRPLPGARVEQFGVRTPPERIASRAWIAAHRAFRRSAVTDASGSAALAFSEFPATFTLIARAGAARSQPWFSSIDGLEGEVVLRLGPQFQASGRVHWPADVAVPEDGLVTASGATNAYLLVLGQARVGSDGIFGPLAVPLFGATRYVFRFEAEGLGVEQHTLPAPEPGADVRVDFSPRPGLALPVHVVDEGGAPVAGAELYLTAGSEGESIHVQAYSDERGSATLPGIPPGSAALDVSADGFPPARLEHLAIGPGPPESLRVELATAAVLSGRVTHAGENVTDFEVAWWTDALFTGQPPTVVRFSGAADGRFELEGLPRARVSLLACSNEHPRSAALTVDLAQGTNDPVELELPAPIGARGRTVDAFTGEPVPGAVVQQFTNAGATFVHAWGAPAVAGPDGSFELPGLAPGDNRLTIQASGYADRLVSIHAGERTDMDLGPLPLFRAMSVVLEYVGDDPRGVEGLHASLIEARHHSAQPFEPDGTSRFDGVAPGRVVAQLVRDDGSSESHILDLPPAERHVVAVGASGSVRLEVAVREEALADLVDPWVSLRDRSASGLRTCSAFLAGAAASFPCTPGATLAVTLWSAGEPLLTREYVVGGGDERLVLDLELRAATLEVVDESGRPVPHAQIHLYTSSAGGWTHVAATDAVGRATVAGLPRHALAGAVSPTYGMRFDVAVESNPPSRPTRIELRAAAALHLRLVDGERPAAGIQVRAMAANDTYLVGYATTDDDGRASFAALGEGSYTVHVEHPGLFRRSLAVATGSRADAPQIAVYALGGVRLTLHRPDGTPLAGALVDATHPGVPGSLAIWLSEGRVRLAGEPRTDAQGRLELPELPAGRLSWRAADADGTVSAGEVDVLPGRTSSVDG